MGEIVKSGDKLRIGSKTNLRTRLEKAKEEESLNKNNPFDRPNRIMLAVDDSGSMSTSMDIRSENPQSRMEVARDAVKEFVKACSPLDTAVGFKAISTNLEQEMTTNFTEIISKSRAFVASGGTPLFQILRGILKREIKPTRVVAISDGEPGDGTVPGTDSYNNLAPEVLKAYVEAKVPIDAVFIGTEGEERAIAIMRYIADSTGGLFIHFKDAPSFKTNLKYLTPAYRAMLTSGQVSVKNIEGGK